MTIGQSLVIQGDLESQEDLVLHGRVDGTITLHNHTLTVGEGATIRADIVANAVVVLGTVIGGVTARERVDLRPTGVMEGQLTTPKLLMEAGAVFGGTIEMPKADRELPAAAIPR